MFCPHCGKEQKQDQRFCSDCGGDLTQSQLPPNQPGSTVPPVPPPQYSPQAPYSASGRETHTDASAKYFAYAGIGIAVIGFFIAGPILGAVAMILGYLAMQKGEKLLGQIAIAAGAIVFVISLFFVMMVGW